MLYHPLFNPIIYGLKMKEINGQLKRLFCKHLNSAHTYTHHEIVNQMEEAIAMTITSTIDDRIANKCITTKIKDVLSGRGIAMARVVGLGSDGANVMEEEAARHCPVAKGIRKRLRTLMFPALTHLLTDVLAMVNRMNLTFQKEDVNISSIQPVVNMTLASLDDLMNGPGEAETKCNEALQDGKFCGITLTQADVQTFSLYVLIICSNSTIVCIIVIHKSLHEPMYMFIAALLINSVLYSTNIYPRLLIDFLSEKQIISYQACLFQNVMYMTFTFSEFSLLAAMAYDRYVSICKPLQYPTIMRKRTVNVCLVLSWLLPTCETAVGFFFLIANSAVLLLGGFFCVSSSALSVYGVFVLINISLLPLIFILFTYTRILIISYQNGRENRRKAAQTCLPHLLVLISFSCLFYLDVVIIRLGLNIPKMTRLILTLQIVSYHSLFNPIIYGLKMKEISKHLKINMMQCIQMTAVSTEADSEYVCLHLSNMMQCIQMTAVSTEADVMRVFRAPPRNH
ncbi:hypothetical protein F7725_002605 [Dissostichus mawsoni]|uniref:G-protein coupled receptors family 1 profile domain-containing protein n=1 Tax=Dissostichus mawsoni TaxID=36200 RepID=A0A7J5Y2U3_DISMA|nr:hypothetical protein F7725_002605 [Dissostichus mawsoni]